MRRPDRNESREDRTPTTQPSGPATIFRAQWDALAGLPRALKKRKAIQQHIADVRALETQMNRSWLEPFKVFWMHRR
ncbi:hypothetical protein [Nitrospina watsonii]|uniref:Uncharacterized protein n=1 Tax=Nitrospina watsonii TaxID=1323948 RepID=A0ABM9HA21_9BACT|nr:hypothetical protein [Nitrospina watsonii]CAI2716979.1 protein of unknown function [Nitrospina watsonii]